ncbi:FecR domain-containing protein [Gimesia aquarii]|uniref:FecR protein n=1 Tax=Gimesia aquarii TaxID=2527964 RepID=A0A517VT65_9PLAN|nr:FecR domain-containing protein [Gimesia aquarii]QDT96196.1 FecR protein [Gimesia aquarii]
MIQPKDRDLLEAYLANELDCDEIKSLELRLCTEEDLARLMIEVSSEETVIREWTELQRSQLWYSKLVTETTVSHSSFYLSRSFLVAMLILAITLTSWFGVHQWADPLIVSDSSQPENVAIVDALSDGELRTQNILCVVNDHLQTGRQYHLDQGVLQLQMDSGVNVVIAGPTTFQFLNSNALRLLQGTMTAHVSQKAIGFEVQTPTLEIIDLGTRFGVHVNKEGVSETHVFQGVVNGFSLKQGSPQGLPQRLSAGQSIKRSPGKEIVLSDTDSDLLFAKCLMQESRIHQLSGDLKLLSNLPVSLKSGEFTSNEHIHVFQERQNISLPEEIRCFVPIQNNKGQFQEDVIQKGTKVDVYYLHHDAHHPGHPEFSDQKTTLTMKGEVHFKGQVLGILQTDPLLLQTDQSLGNPDVRYEKSHVRVAEDETKLLPGRSSLYLNWILSRAEGLKSMNAMRVIVAAEEK